MDASLAFAVFSLTTGLIWGLPPFGHHSDKLFEQRIPLEQIEREIEQAHRDPLEIPTWEPCPGGDCRWRPPDALRHGP
jgi:hypothetical protein